MPAISETADLALRLIKKEMSDVQEKDIINLLSHLEQISDVKRKDALNSSELNIYTDWIPSRTTVKEILEGRVGLVDLKYCIEDFLNFAESKKWGLHDNLDTKLITHIKIMIQQSKITLAPVP